MTNVRKRKIAAKCIAWVTRRKKRKKKRKRERRRKKNKKKKQAYIGRVIKTCTYVLCMYVCIMYF
jgi:cell division septal protein FtsQ